MDRDRQALPIATEVLPILTVEEGEWEPLVFYQANAFYSSTSHEVPNREKRPFLRVQENDVFKMQSQSAENV